MAMNSISILRLSVLIITTSILAGCGAAHVRTEVASVDLHDYDFVYVENVNVHSEEASAEDNDKLQKMMIEWEQFARSEFENYVHESHYKLIEQLPDNPQKTLIANLDIDLKYGNRSLRYWVGFGAGKGGVNSVLSVRDAVSEEEKFRSAAESDLAMGGFGGDMQAVLKKNIRELVEQYPRRDD